MPHPIKAGPPAVGEGRRIVRRSGRMSFKSLYRVDTVPWYWKPPYWIYGYGLGVLLRLWILFVGLTSRIERRGRTPEGPVILALWHENWFVFFCTFLRLPTHVWINHPWWYMRHIHVALRMSGIRLILGSTGNDGREAADRLVERLRAGASTAISPDGPYGPFRVLKKGVLHVALQSGLPIVPVRFRVTPDVRMRSGDRRVMPLPFSKIIVEYGEPWRVTSENFSAMDKQVADGMTDFV